MIQVASKRPGFCASFRKGSRSAIANVVKVQLGKGRKSMRRKGSGNAFEFRFVNVFAKVEHKST